MLYAQNGATDAEIQHDEKRRIIRVSGGKSTEIFSDLRFARNPRFDGVPVRRSGRSSPERGGRRRAAASSPAAPPIAAERRSGRSSPTLASPPAGPSSSQGPSPASPCSGELKRTPADEPRTACPGSRSGSRRLTFFPKP